LAVGLSHHRGRFFVIKIGGELIAPGKLRGVAEGVRALREAGVRVVVVHGGGPQANALTRRLGLEPKQVAGRRVTDEKILQVVKQALAGEAGVDLAALLRAEGLPVIHLSGVAGGLVDATKRPPRRIQGGPDEPVDLGFVGDVSSVNVSLLELLVDAGYVPAIASLGGDDRGGVWNINADTFARSVAAAVEAEALFMVSNVPGVLRDPDDPSTRIPRITPADADRLIEEGIVTGGMIAKVQEALEGVRLGIGAVHVCGAAEGQLLAEAREPGSAGTVFVGDAD